MVSLGSQSCFNDACSQNFKNNIKKSARALEANPAMAQIVLPSALQLNLGTSSDSLKQRVFIRSGA
jgi:hypothetical protein